MDQFRRVVLGDHDTTILNNSNKNGGGDDQPPSRSAFNPPSIISRDSTAFSKPILPSSSSLLSPKTHHHHHHFFNGSGSALPAPPPPLPDPLTPDPNTPPSAAAAVHYRECLRNHAATLGGHVVDGCGEFMPASSADPLKCAACGCHRSFHRREPLQPEPDKPSYRVPLLLPPNPPHPNPLRLSGNTTDQSSSEERERIHTNVVVSKNNNNSSSYNFGRHAQTTEGGGGRKKRFRTKFSSDQKEKMRVFAERVGWRVQKKDEGEMERFCSEVGVRRQVLKVWMHNNKHLVKRQESAALLFEGRSGSKIEEEEKDEEEEEEEEEERHKVGVIRGERSV